MPLLSPAAEPYPDLVAPVQLVELASGIDSLYLSGRAELPERFLDALERKKAEARDVREPVPFVLGGVEFGLAPGAWGRYPYRLSHEYGLVGVTDSAVLPPIRVQPKAVMLHGLGPEGTVDTFSSLVSEVADVRWSIARADLYADVQGWWPTAEERHRFVTRAKALGTFEVSGDLTGLQFGRRSGGGLSARIYEKSGQALKSGADWWLEKWGEEYRPGEPVARVEFEHGRKVLRECGIDTPADLLGDLAGLWGYDTEWLSYRMPGGDRNRSRWPVAPEWEAIRNISMRDEPVTVTRTTASKVAVEEERLIPGLCGFVSSFAAMRNVSTVEESLALIDPVLRDYEHLTGIPFSARVGKKQRRREWGL